MSELEKLLELVGNSKMREEYQQLKAEHEYLMGLAPFEVGDRVTLTHVIDFGHASGWKYMREALQPGAVFLVSEVYFSPYSKGWRLSVFPEVSWDVHQYDGGVIRRKYHCGDPSGDHHSYSFNPDWVRLTQSSDKGLTRPSDATCWGHAYKNRCVDLSHQKAS